MRGERLLRVDRHENENPFSPGACLYIECLQRHLTVCSLRELPTFVKHDPDFWNVISILEPAFPGIDPRGFLKVYKMVCFDVVGTEGLEDTENAGVPREEQIVSAISFADRLYGEPLLIHCKAGVSRSTAVALTLIVRGMHYDGYTMDEIRTKAPEILIGIRPKAMPNPLILEMGLAQVYDPETAATLMADLVNHPLLFANRYPGGRPG